MTDAPDSQAIVSELARAKALFQARTIATVINGGVIIDTESDAGSWADALAHSVHIKQDDV
jgi:hypothetical protein